MDADLTARFVDDITSLSKEGWDTCAGQDNPFLSYDFLSSLERTRCVHADSGWHPQHVIIERERERERERESDNEIIAVMPLYLKGHSQGEYVFDHGWADAYERAGGRYYPKLQSAIPFTPVTGPRLLVNNAYKNESTGLKQALISAATQLGRNASLSSLHLTFVPESEVSDYESAGLLIRNDQQFHWFNKNFETFDDFLATLSSRKRKQIKKERRGAVEADIKIEHISGKDINEDHWDAFFEFYVDTGSRKWGRPYLNREFFSMIGETMADRIVLIMCKREGHYIAGALNFIGSDTIYGRHWGCVEDHPFLHFEACYYQAIDYAIANGLKCVEAGAQGPHKIARGYEPVKTYSAHWLRDEGFHKAVEDFLKVEGREVDAHINYLSERTPFKKAP